uniref:Uncharacterized protein n=1 Tax=Rhizophora mucronata TaxID=61149 RepID=A0A2P2NCH2_RHIMU
MTLKTTAIIVNNPLMFLHKVMLIGGYNAMFSQSDARDIENKVRTKCDWV